MKKRTVALLLALVLCAGCAVGGTVAWLTANTKSVTNTFVVGDIGALELKENDTEASDNTVDFKIIPGVDIAKDIEVSYSYTDNAGDDFEAVPVYVFVKITAPNWTADANHKIFTADTDKLTWSIADGWTYLQNAENTYVYYKAVGKDDSLTEVDVIADGKITVANTITKDNIDEVSAAAGNITVTAYAIQQATFEGNVAGAWAAIPTT